MKKTDTMLYKSRRLISGFFRDEFNIKDIELNKHQSMFLNALLYKFQRTMLEDLFFAFDAKITITQSDLIEYSGMYSSDACKKVGIDANGGVITYIDKLFEDIYNVSITLRDVILPEFRNGKVVLEDGLVKFGWHSQSNFRILSDWGRVEGAKQKTYSFILNPFLSSLTHLQTLTAKNNGIGYTPLKMQDLQRIKSVSALRFYELICRETYKKTFHLTPIELQKILYININKQFFTIRRDLKNLCEQLMQYFKIIVVFDIKIQNKQLGNTYFHFRFPEDSDYEDFKHLVFSGKLANNYRPACVV